jgi:hypothetical protein
VEVLDRIIQAQTASTAPEYRASLVELSRNMSSGSHESRALPLVERLTTNNC